MEKRLVWTILLEEGESALNVLILDMKIEGIT